MALWFVHTTATAVDRLTDVLRATRSHHDHPIGLIQEVTLTATQPDTEARKALNTMLQLGPGVIRCSSIVVPGVGFRVAWIRAFISGLAMLARPGFPHVVFDSIDQAAQWQQHLLEGADVDPPKSTQLVDAHEELHAAFAAR